ncbi:MAG: HdeD family acid-resistance protein [Alphaproteobacteria bacterium]|nr:HdeD family acid-resistance protein [Alphaproteobacteria bacterium]
MTNQDPPDKPEPAASEPKAETTDQASGALGGIADTPEKLVHAFEDLVKQHRNWFLVLGVVWIVLGSAAIIVPQIASLAVELLVGWLLAVGGIATLIHAFRCKGWQEVVMAVISGILYLAAGVILLLFPLQGVLTLTLLLGVIFVVEGILRCIIAVRARPTDGWGWMLAGAIATIVVGLLIWGEWPSSAAWAIGLLVGIQLVFSGWSMVAVANAAKDK